MRTITVSGAIFILLGLATPAASQDRTEELERRLEQMERLLQVLQVQVAEQAGAKVAPSSGNLVELRGLVLMNAFTNTNGVFMDDVPQWVHPSTGCQECHEGTSATIRQTRLTFSAFAAGVLGADFAGELDVDFFGGQPHSSGGRTFPNLRIRTTHARLDWEHVSLLVGQEAPPIAAVNPSSLAAMGFPAFTGAGNLWLWLPQISLSAHTTGLVRYGVEGTVMAPADGQPREENFYGMPDLAERTSRPFFESRVFARWGEPDNGGEISFGAHMGWLEPVDSIIVQSKAIAASAQFFITPSLEFRGEAFAGQGMRSLGGGGIYQNFGAANRALSTRGGWFQLNYLPGQLWELGLGAGIDDPDESDFRTGGGRGKNVQYEVHSIWRLSPLVAGLEVRRMETTTYKFGDPDVEDSNWHFNLALGFEF